MFCRESRARVSLLLGSSGVRVSACVWVCVCWGREVIRSDLLGFLFFFFFIL